MSISLPIHSSLFRDIAIVANDPLKQNSKFFLNKFKYLYYRLNIDENPQYQ